MLKVLLISNFPQKVQHHFAQELQGMAQVIVPEQYSEDELSQLSGDVDVMIGWHPTDKILKSAPKLKLFINPGAGVEHQIKLFRQYPEITLVNSHGNSYATAQHGFALLMALANQVIPHHNWMVEGKWRLGDDEAKSSLLRRKTLGLLGFGAIGQRLVRFTQGFELNRIAYKSRPMEEKPEWIDQVYYGDGLEEFLHRTDFLIVAVPHNASTDNMLGEKELELLGPEGLLINIARGPVVNEEALYMALKNGLIKGAAIDVWYDYSPIPDSLGRMRPYHYPFHELPNVILSPHRADSPDDDLIRWEDVLFNIKKLYEGKNDFLNLVDLQRGY